MSFWYIAKESDLVIPFLQEFLSSVEELKLWSLRDYSIVEVPYVLLYNIVTSNQPRLKHLKVCDISLEAAFMLFCTHECEEMPSVNNKRILVSRIPKPYRLEGITIIISFIFIL